MTTAYVEERSQPQRGHWGPDRYIAVQVVPGGVTPLKVLRRDLASKRGIKLIFCGEGYSRRTTRPTSMLRQARRKAARIAAQINASV